MSGYTSSYGNNRKQRIKIDRREHRTVILPDFQGLGFGSRVSDGMAELLALHNKRYQSKTAHPR